MKQPSKTLELKFERKLSVSPDGAYDAWPNPKVPGNPWNMGDKLILDPEVDGDRDRRCNDRPRAHTDC